MGSCFSCGVLLPTGKIFFGDSCEKCGEDLHVCANCEFYDTGYANDCREPQVEKILEKEKKNFCELFSPSLVGGIGKKQSGDDLKKIADTLFKK